MIKHIKRVYILNNIEMTYSINHINRQHPADPAAAKLAHRRRRLQFIAEFPTGLFELDHSLILVALGCCCKVFRSNSLSRQQNKVSFGYLRDYDVVRSVLAREFDHHNPIK